MQDSQHFTVQQSIAAQPVGDELVLLNLESGIYYSLNPVGACVWSGLLEGKTRAEIVEDILGEFDVTREQAMADVDAFLEKLGAWGLITAS
jgi:hypothetical protein